MVFLVTKNVPKIRHGINTVTAIRPYSAIGCQLIGGRLMAVADLISMAAVRAGSFLDTVRFMGPVRFTGPVRFAWFGQWPKSSRDAKTEMVRKIVTMIFSLGPFCTAFWRELFCDQDAFWNQGSTSKAPI